MADRFDDIDLNALLVYLIDIADSSVLPWLAEQFSLFGDGWELAESDDSKRALIKAAIDLHRSKGTPWSIKEIIRRFGFGESTLIENIGRLSYDGEATYNNLYVHGDKAAWAVYRVLLKQPITNDQARMLRNAIGMFAPARVIWPASNIGKCLSATTGRQYTTVTTIMGALEHGEFVREPAMG
uniref:Tail fiber n=1 Tax=Pectobacterium carotovorum TaxID=554 RepID=Q9WXA4_PECCA|nr:tail fiber [Pectobacterium carotovorum]